MEFIERTKAPAKNNKSYYGKENIFYPNYVDNCTWYAWGRQLELGVDFLTLMVNLPTSNAENWYKETSFQKCSFARVGDIGCYKCGKYHKASDGAGHVFIVEKVYDDKSIDISESGVNMKFKTRHLKYPYKYYLKSKYEYTFEGFIHIQDYDDPYFINDGVYKTLKQKYVRTTPEVANNKVKYKSLPNSVKSGCNKTALGYARYKKDTILHLNEFRYDNKGNLWGRNNNYWLCVKDDSGKQVKKVDI